MIISFGRILGFELGARSVGKFTHFFGMSPSPMRFRREVISIASGEVQTCLTIFDNFRHGSGSGGNHRRAAGKSFYGNEPEGFVVSLGWPHQKARTFDQVEALLPGQIWQSRNRRIFSCELLYIASQGALASNPQRHV